MEFNDGSWLVMINWIKNKKFFSAIFGRGKINPGSSGLSFDEREVHLMRGKVWSNGKLSYIYYSGAQHLYKICFSSDCLTNRKHYTLLKAKTPIYDLVGKNKLPTHMCLQCTIYLVNIETFRGKYNFKWVVISVSLLQLVLSWSNLTMVSLVKHKRWGRKKLPFQ